MTTMQKIGYALLKAFLWPLSKLPLGFHRAMGRVIYFLAYRVAGYRKDVVMMNLARCFPELEWYELRDIRKQFYKQFGRIFAEAIWFGGCTNPERLRRSGIVKMANPQVLNELYAKGNVMVLASHNGNWELFGGMKTYGTYNGPLDAEENNLAVVYLKQTSAVWNEFFFHNRTAPIVDKKNFDGLQESRDIMRYVFNHKDERKIYFFITDQRPYFESAANLEVDFLGKKTQTMTGSVALAKMFGMSVVYQDMKPDGKGNYEITFTTLCENAAEEEIPDIIEKYYKHLEEDIRKTPWNYLWTHNRWWKPKE